MFAVIGPSGVVDGDPRLAKPTVGATKRGPTQLKGDTGFKRC